MATSRKTDVGKINILRYGQQDTDHSVKNPLLTSYI